MARVFEKYECLGDELNVAIGTNTKPTVPAGTAFILIEIENANVRWRDSGDHPSATDGFLLHAGDVFWFDGDVNALELTKVSGSPTATFGYYRPAQTGSRSAVIS